MQTAKETLESIQYSDPEYRRRTRIAMQPYLDCFSAQLKHLYNLMPLKYRVTEAGVEQIIDPEWQAIIDKVKKQQEDDLHSLFPEYFRH